MQVEKIELSKTNSFSSFFIDYISNKIELAPFYGHKPEIENFKDQISQKSFSDSSRKALNDTLNRQYAPIQKSSTVDANINGLLDENTFTITTGHQLNIFTGPLYFIYKIITVLNTCKVLKSKYPENNFVPVYWMASEDHDFDEINHFNLFGKKYSWDSDQKGAVGRFNTETIKNLLKELPEQSPLFEKAYTEFTCLSDAVRFYVNELFGGEGVIVLDADDRSLKSQFSTVIADDLMNHHANDLVEETSSKLNSLGYSAQIFPRAINFFYLDGDIRERIVKENSKWNILNTELSFSEEEIKSLIQNKPEKFSPNVVMRPLYQEVILPNLAYVGGPAEVVYWMQLKAVFEKYNVPFPILMPRNFGLVVNKPALKKMNKFGYGSEDLFQKVEELRAEYLTENGSEEIDFSKEKNELQQLFDKLSAKALGIDGSLKGFIGAEASKAQKSLDIIEKRLRRADEQKHEVALNQIAGLIEKLFPNGSPQERTDNFLNFYLNNNEFINELIQSFDPFDYRMHVLTEE